jgi:hypothetical protein
MNNSIIDLPPKKAILGNISQSKQLFPTLSGFIFSGSKVNAMCHCEDRVLRPEAISWLNMGIASSGRTPASQ